MNDQMSRREFTSVSLAAGVAVATGARAAANAHGTGDTDVLVKTPGGVCDAALIHPKGHGAWPSVILFADAFGLRPAMREMAARLASGGYTVLVPNPYYRSTKAPGIDSASSFDFNNPSDRQKLMALRAPLTGDAVMQDATAYVAFLDSQASVKPSAKIGVFGYCMGGAMTMQAASALPGRVGAGASFHGGGLVTDKPDSPHLLVPRIKAEYYFGIAANDDAKEPEAKIKLREAFDSAAVRAKIDVYAGCMHGWCVKDMPMGADGKPIYNEAEAERAWGELVTLFKRSLV